jgi:hypothetical protein
MAVTGAESPRTVAVLQIEQVQILNESIGYREKKQNEIECALRYRKKTRAATLPEVRAVRTEQVAQSGCSKYEETIP